MAEKQVNDNGVGLRSLLKAFNDGVERARADDPETHPATVCATCPCGKRTTHGSGLCRRCR